MTKLDITSLGGDDLWDALSSGSTITAKAPTKKQKLASSILNTPIPTPKPDWIDKAIVMLVHTSYCECGKSFEHPNPHQFIRRESLRTKAIHWRALDEFHYFAPELMSHLPFEIKHEAINIKTCPACFGLEKLIQGQAITHITSGDPLIPLERLKPVLPSDFPTIDKPPVEADPLLPPSKPQAIVKALVDDIEEVDDESDYETLYSIDSLEN